MSETVSVDVGAAYRAGRQRVNELVAGLTPEAAATKIPTCPAWTVHDVLAHMAGTCTDILTGNLDGVASDAWTAKQVDTRRDRSIAELLDEWNHAAEQVEGFASAFPGRTGTQWLFDMTTHEHDLRLALGRPGSRDSEAVAASAAFLVEVGLRPHATVRGLGPLWVHLPDRVWRLGTAQAVAGDPFEVDAAVAAATNDTLMGGTPLPEAPESMAPVAELKITPFELMRASSGRRSAAQIRSFDWSGDPEPYLAAFGFGPFTISGSDIVE